MQHDALKSGKLVSYLQILDEAKIPQIGDKHKMPNFEQHTSNKK